MKIKEYLIIWIVLFLLAFGAIYSYTTGKKNIQHGNGIEQVCINRVAYLITDGGGITVKRHSSGSVWSCE